jgi:hypothetical protein
MPCRERIPLILWGYAPCGGIAAKDIGNKFPGKSETFRISGRQSRLTWRRWDNDPSRPRTFRLPRRDDVRQTRLEFFSLADPTLMLTLNQSELKQLYQIAHFLDESFSFCWFDVIVKPFRKFFAFHFACGNFQNRFFLFINARVYLKAI